MGVITACTLFIYLYIYLYVYIYKFLHSGGNGIGALSPKIKIFQTAVTRHPGNILTSCFLYSFHHVPYL